MTVDFRRPLFFVVIGLLLSACGYNLNNQPGAATPVSLSEEPLTTTNTQALVSIGTSISSSSSSTPLKIGFVMAKAPALNEPVSIKATITSALDLPDTTAQLEIPSSAVLVSGTLNFEGDLKKNEAAEFEAIIKFVKEGNAIVRAITTKVISQDEVWGDAAYIYLSIGKESSHFGFEGATFPVASTPATNLPSPPAVSPLTP